MPNNYSLKIINFQILTNHEKKKNVVSKITFSVNAENEDNLIGSLINCLDLKIDNIANFVEFEDLTESQVCNWILDKVDNAKMQEFYKKADQQLQNLNATNQIVVNPPWS